MDAVAFDKFVRDVRRLWAKLQEKRCRVKAQPPAGGQEVAAFERRSGIALPEEYRQFLLQVANGGAWLYSLSDYDRRGSFKGKLGDFRKPFPHERAWNLSAAEFAAMPDEGVDDAGYEAFWRDYFRPDLIDGAIPLSDGGCSRWYLLVVTGPQRGKVWVDERGSDSGIFPPQTRRAGTWDLQRLGMRIPCELPIGTMRVFMAEASR